MKLFYSLVAAGALLAASANAQVWPKPTTSGNFSTRAAALSTGIAVNAAALRDTSAGLDVLVYSVNGDTPLTLNQYLDNSGSAGSLVSSTSVTATSTPKTVHINGPQIFQWIKVSPTTAITNTLVSVTLIQSK